MKQTPISSVLEELGQDYVLFLKKPKRRQYLLRRIEARTKIVCANERVVEIVKHRAKNKLDHLKTMV